MRSNLQSLLMITLVGTAWVNALMMQVKHNNSLYWIGHIDHVSKKDDGAPFEFFGKTTPLEASTAVSKFIRNRTDQDILVGTFNEHFRGKFLRAGSQNDYLFGHSKGDFIIVTQDLTAKVDASTWNEIIDKNHDELYRRLDAERGAGSS
ncbi:hypothetical protein PGT21_023646 [Puccinia graminis f. sp. tritici]|uniref:Uncharacterized protein n=1 Tax=Puccinia graminis f. sp. tritici TaxID=56615 RepID=A0A5B0LNQ9_PUCGR|nr:hypothetical protein PGT21_023646 [Puccinia graminis f. sp. tritici]KAA1072641.1 hypothetical protein PGTUg99_006801 [Puccinia graminis f. sp. tritici]